MVSRSTTPQTDTFVVPERRPVSVVFQDYLLFPSLTALENVAFGLRARGVPKVEARTHAHAWLERVGLADHAHHRPRALSGGQAQRVALARALATEPRLLLLDEPLAALDAGTRGEVRRDLRRHLTTFDGVRLLVTHDPVDAFALADRVVILERGQVVQTGTLADVTAQPRSRYVADLVGINLLQGVGHDGAITTVTGGQVVPAHPVRGEAFAVIQPHSVALYPSPPAGSPRNVWAVTVADVDRQPDRVPRPPHRSGAPRRRDHPRRPRCPRPAARTPDLGLRQSDRDHHLSSLSRSSSSRRRRCGSRAEIVVGA